MKPAAILKPGDKEYFASWFRLQHRDLYLIWIRQYDAESVVVNEQGYIPIFSSEMALAAYANTKSLEIIDEEPGLHDLDATEEWLLNILNPIDCHNLLIAWNMFTDVANGLQVSFIGDKHNPLRNRIYDKLYFGINDPISKVMSGRSSGDIYIPQWSLKEREKIAQVLTQGLAMFKSKILEVKM